MASSHSNSATAIKPRRGAPRVKGARVALAGDARARRDARPGSRRATSSDPGENYLARYFKEMAALSVLKPEEEFESARRIEGIEVGLWAHILAYSPVLEPVLAAVEASIEEPPAAHIANLRRAHKAARKQPSAAARRRVEARAASAAQAIHTADVDRQALFAAMGRVAKSDGRMREEEIAFAEQFMRHIGLTPAQRRRAIEAFRQGKDPSFPLSRPLATFHHRAARHPEFFTLFLETLLKLARADGPINAEEERQLIWICQRLRISSFQYLTLKMAVEGQFRFQQRQTGRQEGAPRQTNLSRREACRILGVPPTASREEIKRAYRRLMSRYHPDKLASRGVEASRIREATEKVQQIRRAYEVLIESV